VTASSQLEPGTAGAPLREGRAPVSERLTAMLLLAALLHAIVILGLTFTTIGRGGGGDTPQLDVLLVTDEVPEAQSNDAATYLAQRTQLGSGNTDLPLPAARPSSDPTAARTPATATVRASLISRYSPAARPAPTSVTSAKRRRRHPPTRCPNS
jgi:hypothetical protein